MGYMAGLADNFIRFFASKFAPGIDNLRRNSVAFDCNWMVTRGYSTGRTDVTPFTERGIFVGGTEKKLHQGFLFIFNGMGGVAGGTLHCPVIVEGKVFRDFHPVRWDIAYPVSRVITDLVTGIAHRTVMTGKTHLPCADYPCFLEWGERRSPAL